MAAAHRSTVTRFSAREVEPGRVVPLASDHPALSEGRTIFPATVTASKDSPRFLVSGHNNTKLGKEVLKGPLKGAAIFQLSLEERATCPRTCQQWDSCYGNSMPFARRHKPDADFERLLVAEDEPAPVCLNTEASETTEASADLQRCVREASADGKITPLEACRIRAGVLRVQAEASDVLRGAS